MWNQLGVFGSRLVEAVFVSEDKNQATEEPEEDSVRSEGRGVEGTVGAEELEESVAVIEKSGTHQGQGVRSEGSGVEGTVGAEELEVRMEGSDVKTLIAKRMGISKGEVDTRLISLHQKGELNGTADRSSDPSDRSNPSGSGSGKSPTLTKNDLEDFERAEAEARNGTPSQTGTPFKLAFKPAVLNPSASPRTPRTPPARPAPATPAPSAERQDDEVEMVHTQPQSGTSQTNWSEEMEAEETTPDGHGISEGSGVEGAVGADGHGKSEGSGVEGAVGAESKDAASSDVWPEPRKRYVEAVEAEHIYSAVEAIEVPLLNQDDLGVEQLQYVVRDVVGQVNTAHKQLATAGYVVAERSREALQQAKISSNMATEALLKSYEVSAVAASTSRQSWKMCVTFTGPDMPVRSKEAERKPDTTGRYLAQSLFGVILKPEEVSISHFRGATSNDFIIKFTRTGFVTSHEDLLHASKALGRDRQLQVYVKIPAAEVDSEIYFLLRCMVKAGEAENAYTARSGCRCATAQRAQCADGNSRNRMASRRSSFWIS
jgi:hypothetical protein